MDVKVDVGDLSFGMFVAELDRPWADTSFLFQGFLLEDDTQLSELQQQCSYVVVSVERSAPGLFPEVDVPTPGQMAAARLQPNSPARPTPMPRASGSNGFFGSLKTILKEALEHRDVHQPAAAHAATKTRKAQAAEPAPIAAGDEKQAYIDSMRALRQAMGVLNNGESIHLYENTAELTHEVRASEKLHREFCDLASGLMEHLTVDQLGERIDLANELIASVVDSMLRNAEAMSFLSQLRGMDDDAYSRAVNVSVRLIALGRQLGFPKEQLQNLGMGGLLLDIGRTRLPRELRSSRERYTPEEFEIEKSHVMEGVLILRETMGIRPEIIELVWRHHERHDGSGYPEGVRGQGIGLFGSMAGIVDTYCGLTAKRPYATPMTSANALGAIVDMGEKLFHPALVDQFVQTIGIYPVGCLVELTNSEIGIVVRQNRMRRLRPAVLLILDPERAPYSQPTTIDLMYTHTTPEGEPLSIRQELNAGAYGIDPADYFL